MPVLICLRKELWTGLISVGDQVPTCPVFTRAKIKSRLGILVNLPSQSCTCSYTSFNHLCHLKTQFLHSNKPFLIKLMFHLYSYQFLHKIWCSSDAPDSFQSFLLTVQRKHVQLPLLPSSEWFIWSASQENWS